MSCHWSFECSSDVFIHCLHWLRCHNSWNFWICNWVILNHIPNRSEFPFKEMENSVVLRVYLKSDAFISKLAWKSSHNILNVILISEFRKNDPSARILNRIWRTEILRPNHIDLPLRAQIIRIILSLRVNRLLRMILNHLTRKQRQLNPETLIQLIPMHQLRHLRSLNSPIVKQPVQHKSIDDDKNNHEVKHSDDTPHPSLSRPTSNRQ